MQPKQRTASRILRHVFALTTGFACISAAQAQQDYPNRPVRYVVPNTPGVIVDTVARVVAAEMNKTLGQPVVIENKPGGNYVVGFEYTARQAPADGYTVVSVLVPSMAILPVTTKDLRFDPLKD